MIPEYPLNKKRILLYEVLVASFISAVGASLVIVALDMPGKTSFIIIGGVATILVAMLSGDIRLFTVVATAFVVPLSFSKHFNPIPHMGGAYSINISLAEAGLITLYVLWVMKIYPKVSTKFITPLNGVLFAIIPLSLFSLYNTIYYTLAGYELIRMSIMFLLFFYISSNVRNIREVTLIVGALLTMTLLQSFYGMLQYMVGLSVPIFAQFGETEMVKESLGEFLSVARVGGTMGHPNVLAGFMVLMLPLALALLLSELKLVYKLFLSMVLIFGTMTLILTLSRGGWMSFGVAAIVVLLLASRGRVLRYGNNAFIIAIILSVFILIGLAFSGAIYLKITASPESSIVSRWELMKTAMTMIKEHPIIGVGINSFSFIFPRYDISGIPWGPWNPPVHNIYLLVWSETGTVGLASFILIMIFLFRVGFRVLKHSRDITTLCIVIGIMGGMTGFFTHFSVDWTFRTDTLQRTFWLLAGSLAAIDRLVIEEMGKREDIALEAAAA